jgi:hypothetical protein
LSAARAADVTITADASRTVQVMRGGFGASWHAIEEPMPVEGDRSHGGSAWGAHPPANDTARWKQIYRHADWLGLDFVRVEVEQRMYQPARDRFTWDTPEMKILYRILDWCERRGADVFLQQMWGNVDWNAFPEFLGDPIKRLHSGPLSMDDYGNGIAALVKHLTRTKRYTCIKWICINNEPRYDWSWWQKPPNDPMSLRDGLAATRRALDREGITIPLSGPDWTDLPELKPEEIDFDEFIGAYDLHSYYARFDWGGKEGYPMTQAEQRLKDWRRWATSRNKPLFLSEVGTMVFGWRTNHPGPSTWDAAIKDAELVVRALNLGVEGFNRWSFVNRGDLDGVWQMIDTWDPQTQQLLQSVTPRPNAYFVYGLISRLTAKHSSVLACGTRGGQIDGMNRVFATALKSPKGNLTWMLVNDAPRAWSAELKLAGAAAGKLHKYQVTPAQRDQPGLEINPVSQLKLTAGAGTFTETLPPSSLTIYSSYRLKHSDRGVTAE